jgi:hypothetical protein
MADQDLDKLSDKELVHEAFSGHGERFAELTRRLKHSNEFLARVIIVLTVVLVFVGLVDLYLRLCLGR